MRLAVTLQFLLPILLATAATNIWASERSPVRVEAMVGAAVVVFEDIECPEDVVEVPTGQVAITYPDECDMVVGLNTVSDTVSDVVWAIASTDPDDAEAVQDLLVGLTTAEQTLVIVVLINNAQHLGTNDDYVIATMAAISRENPGAVPLLVVTGSVLRPDLQQDIIDVVKIAAPEEIENIDLGVVIADDIVEDFQDNQQPGPGDDDYTPGTGDDSDVEVISVEDQQPQPPVDTPKPPVNR